jgi:hypothetical protein
MGRMTGQTVVGFTLSQEAASIVTGPPESGPPGLIHAEASAR